MNHHTDLTATLRFAAATKQLYKAAAANNLDEVLKQFERMRDAYRNMKEAV